MMDTLIDLMRRRFPVDIEAAARLCMSRQAYSQAIKRGRFSNETALRCADLLEIDRAAALLCNCPAAEYLPAPVSNPGPDPTPETPAPPPLYYVKSDNQQKSNDYASGKKKCTVHSITSDERKNQLDIVRWCLAVAKLPADSPRFAWYVSRWHVPEKIARAKESGTFDDLTRNCPPFDPSLIRFVPAALQECADYAESIKKPTPTKPASCPQKKKPRNSARLAA